MTCPRCAKENPDDGKFCSRCGLEFASVVQKVASDAEARPCYRHPKVMTLVSCGKCDKPLCPDCVIVGASGVRCKECAKHNIPFSPRGALNDVRLSLGRMFRGSPYSIYILLLLASVIFGGFRGCAAMQESRQEPPPVVSEEE